MDSEVVIVAGKGGVGSSTVAAALALAAAQGGADVLFVGVDERPGMGPLLGGSELDATERVLRAVEGGGTIRGRTVPADVAFRDYLELKGVGRFLRRAAAATSLPMIAAATPGMEHLLKLGMIKEFQKEGVADRIIVDAPPAGHAAPFLRSARGLAEAIDSGPVLEQALEVLELLTDPNRCHAILVTLAEETPVNEAIELADELSNDLEIDVRRVVANACWPDRPGLAKTPAMAARSHAVKLSATAKRVLGPASAFGRSRLALQRDQLARLEASVAQPVVVVPRLPTPRVGPDDLAELARHLDPELA